MQLLWTVVSYLLNNVKHGNVYNIHSIYGELDIPEIYSRFDNTLQLRQMMNFIVC